MPWIDWPSTHRLAASGTLFRDVMPWLLVLLGAVLVGTVLIIAVRRMLRPDEPAVPGFTLHGLRQMHARGELSDEEFAQARDSMIRGMRDAATADSGDRDDPSTTGNPPGARR